MIIVSMENPGKMVLFDIENGLIARILNVGVKFFCGCKN